MPTAEKTKKKNQPSDIENKKDEQLSKQETKKCFIITPIGDEHTEIRRQIDGVIDVCIEPILKQFDYEIFVAHRISSPGSINNQVLGHIYKDEMVIANLTGLNPNVMYELAFRHAIRKPVIVIKNKRDNCKLPFDIKDDRVILYDNDIKGTDELKKMLFEYMKEIDSNNVDNPISRAITDINVRESLMATFANGNENQVSDLKYVIDRLDSIENSLISKVNDNIIKNELRFNPVDNINTFDEYFRTLNNVNAFLNETSDNSFVKFEIIGDIIALKDKYCTEPNTFTEEQKHKIELLFRSAYIKLGIKPL